MTPQISIVVPVRDRGPLAVATLDSIAAQTVRPAQLIIVDNGSGPATRKLLEAWVSTNAQCPVALITEPRPGATFARNAGLAMCRSEWTLFFDSDDTMVPTHLAAAQQAAIENPDADIIGWDAQFVDMTGRELRAKIFPSDHFLYHAVMQGSLATQCYMARTSLFREAGGWSPRVHMWDDMELSVRLLMLNPTIAKAQQSRDGVKILTQADSITGLDFSSRAEDCNRTLRHLDAMAFRAATRSDLPREFHDLRVILALKRTILAACCRREGSPQLARKLYREALAASLTKTQRMALRLAYHYTRLGLRGAARMLCPIFD